MKSEVECEVDVTLTQGSGRRQCSSSSGFPSLAGGSLWSTKVTAGIKVRSSLTCLVVFVSSSDR